MATVEQHTTQLEFHQAMADFKTMFPTMDVDVIEAVLRSNQGAVDATIDQLLFMSSEMDQPDDPRPPPPDVVDERETLRLLRRWNPPLLAPLPHDFLRLSTDAKQSVMWFYTLWNKLRIRRRWKKRYERMIKAELAFCRMEADLEDERIAMLLQNEEFMAELRWNKDFLSALDNDSPEERFTSFPGRAGDDEAIFKERLRNMGKMSRKKFSQLARVFTGRKKRTPTAKTILNQGTAPSKDNLLLREDLDSDY